MRQHKHPTHATVQREFSIEIEGATVATVAAPNFGAALKRWRALPHNKLALLQAQAKRAGHRVRNA